MCTEAPDTSGQQELARTTAKLSEEQLAWAKEIYADTAPARARAEQRATAISDAQLASMGLQDSIARDYDQHHKTNFRPLETKIATDALAFDTPQRREAEAGQAMADVGSLADAGRETAMRELAARGVDPSSGNAAVTLSRSAIQEAAAKAAAGNAARKQVETIGAAKLADAANLGRNIASGQATQASLALNAGNASAANALASLAPSQQAQQTMHGAYGSARQGYGQAAGIYGDASKQQTAADSSNNATMGSLAGSAMMLLAMSDKKEKEGSKPVDTEMALSAVRKMPVKKWKYKRSSRADDGGKPHVGPMAQDVHASLGDGVAPGGEVIDLVSMNGVTLAAVQALDKKVSRLEKHRG